MMHWSYRLCHENIQTWKMQEACLRRAQETQVLRGPPAATLASLLSRSRNTGTGGESGSSLPTGPGAARLRAYSVDYYAMHMHTCWDT